jgi:hypothetical protein
MQTFGRYDELVYEFILVSLKFILRLSALQLAHMGRA